MMSADAEHTYILYSMLCNEYEISTIKLGVYLAIILHRVP